jgi:hypothetical protein
MRYDFRTGELRHTCWGLYTKWLGFRDGDKVTSARYDSYKHMLGLGLGRNKHE